MKQNKQGSIVCVGVGMTLGSHISALTRSYIENADVVFTGMSHQLIEQWVEEMNSNVISLQKFYQEGKDRRETYHEMVAEMMVHVRAGKKVVGAFYGHPGVFAWAPHKVIDVARREGFAAHMEPGVSAEDCLYADLNIDPGKHGALHYETSQFMFYHKQIDPTAFLILWQIGLAGDRSLTTFSAHKHYRSVLISKLSTQYTLDHEVTIYESPTLPIHTYSAQSMPLSELVNADINQHSTLVIPPIKDAIEDQETISKLANIRKSLD